MHKCVNAAKGCLVVLALLLLEGFLGPAAWGNPHPSGVPVLSSRPGAPYTLYLDFAGFNFSGTWTGFNGSGFAPAAPPPLLTSHPIRL